MLLYSTRTEKVSKRSLLTFFIILSALSFAGAQKNAFGPEFQAYPTGLLPGLHYERALASEQWALSLRLGANLFDHRDFGPHLSEKGKGLGLSLGMNYHLHGFSQNGLYFGLRTDVWRNVVQWIDVLPQDDIESGTTRILVLQPTALAGWQLGGEQWKFRFDAGFGFEINVITEGEPTGQGAIFLLGISALRTF